MEEAVQRAWKSGLTEGRPVDQVRNMIGNEPECHECRTIFRFDLGDGFVISGGKVVCPTCDLMRQVLHTKASSPQWPKVGYRGITNYVYGCFVPEHSVLLGGGPCYKCSETSCSKIYDLENGWANVCRNHQYPQMRAWDRWVHMGDSSEILTAAPGKGQRDILLHARHWIQALPSRD